VTLDLGGERKHSAEDFAEWGDVILGDPGCKPHQLVGENRDGVEDLLDRLGLDTFGKLVIVQTDNHTHEPLAAKGNEDARADDRDNPIDCIGKVLVEWDGQGYITENGHRSFELNGFDGRELGAGSPIGGLEL
jgi:hypothetical protein